MFCHVQYTWGTALCGVLYLCLLLRLLSDTVPSVGEVQLQTLQRNRFLSQCVTGQEMEARVYRWQSYTLPMVGNIARYTCIIDRYNRNANWILMCVQCVSLQVDKRRRGRYNRCDV